MEENYNLDPFNGTLDCKFKQPFGGGSSSIDRDVDIIVLNGEMIWQISTKFSFINDRNFHNIQINKSEKYIKFQSSNATGGGLLPTRFRTGNKYHLDKIDLDIYGKSSTDILSIFGTAGSPQRFSIPSGDYLYNAENTISPITMKIYDAKKVLSIEVPAEKTVTIERMKFILSPDGGRFLDFYFYFNEDLETATTENVTSGTFTKTTQTTISATI